jgi:hypothetical protein
LVAARAQNAKWNTGTSVDWEYLSSNGNAIDLTNAASMMRGSWSDEELHSIGTSKDYITSLIINNDIDGLRLLISNVSSVIS